MGDGACPMFHKMQETDSELLDAYRRGSVDALERLVEKHRRMLYGYIVNMSGSQVNADDVFQEVWIRVIKKMDSYQHGNFGGWLVRIARNIVIDGARKRKPDVSIDREDGDGRSLAITLTADDFEPSHNVEAGELGARIACAVKELPLEQREVFLMRVQADLPFKEIARIQKTSINTALARMQYALGKLRPLLKDDYDALTRK